MPAVTLGEGVEVDVPVGTAVLVAPAVGEGTEVLVATGDPVAVLGAEEAVTVGLPWSRDGAAIPDREVPGRRPRRIATSARVSAGRAR